MKDGPDKGKVQEMKYDVAIRLIDAGRAELHNWDIKPAEIKKSPTRTPEMQEQSSLRIQPPETPAIEKKKKKK